MKSLDEKIEKQQEVLAKSKERYEKDKAELAQLLKARNEFRKNELMDAIVKSDKSFDEIMAFISGSSRKE
ncbi:MAG: hypothetical protein PHR92_15710 [Lachnospiraceae bacterium]|nr:hypothetical protein [Lachnospiraceae bacterium]